MGLSHFRNRFEGEYIQQSIVEIINELKLFISLLTVENVIFRSNHISNNLILAGTLSKDKTKLLHQIEAGIKEIPEDIMPEHSSDL